ncbi:hypothetical protein IP92_01440 [Pseudoduganella flava]|uniref:Uncharacterized protein n=1 Tax=Pseudoduganella flava TaxID=871742 RepID=A0A562Q0J8_9BURK|nr:hypothetical protein [Pseudoduganella flava]QGZ38254.1 hypothetical protein GO485_03780 [Pseudoduganella flava]TWI50211.1 hypothetical protein IP92_01440 [Pseudoduganella flava]
MSSHRQPAAPANQHVPAQTVERDRQSDDLDEALDESFPASDPVAVTITSVDPAEKQPRT